MVDTDS